MLRDPILKKYFAPNFIWHLSSFKSQAEFQKMMKLLRETNPKTVIGCYSSACTTVLAKDDLYPPTTIPLEQCKPDWLLRDKKGGLLTWGKDKKRFIFDMRRKDIREMIISLAIARAKYYGFDALCFDNCYWGYVNPKASVSVEEWTNSFMQFYNEAGKSAHDANLLCVVNVATNRVSLIPDAFRAIAPYVDGLMTETPLHPNLRQKKKVDKELKAYEDVLKQNKIVLLIQRKSEEGKRSLKIIRPLAKKYPNLYLNFHGMLKYESLIWIEN